MPSLNILSFTIGVTPFLLLNWQMWPHSSRIPAEQSMVITSYDLSVLSYQFSSLNFILNTENKYILKKTDLILL